MGCSSKKAVEFAGIARRFLQCAGGMCVQCGQGAPASVREARAGLPSDGFEDSGPGSLWVPIGACQSKRDLAVREAPARADVCSLRCFRAGRAHCQRARTR